MKKKFKSEKGVTGIDLVTGLIIFVLTSVVVVNLYYQIYINTVATKVHAVLLGCITDIFEKVDLESYENVTEENIKGWSEYQKLTEYFNESKNGSTVTCSITKYQDTEEVEKDLVKEINITVNYSVGSNNIKFPINKLKVKEIEQLP